MWTGGEFLCGSELNLFTRTFGCSDLAIVSGFCLKMVLSEIIWSRSASRSSGFSPPVVDGGAVPIWDTLVGVRVESSDRGRGGGLGFGRGRFGLG